MKIIYKNMDDKKTSRKIGRISLSLSERGNKKFVIIKADPNQSFENKEISRDWINNTFLKKSPYKSGIVSFSEEEWKNPEGPGKKFVEGIKKSPYIITWKDESKDKTIMKGLKALFPAVMQGALGGITGQPLGGQLGGAKGGMSPFGLGAAGELSAAGLGGLGKPGEPSGLSGMGGTGSPGDNPATDLSHVLHQNKITFKEYIDKTSKIFRKSGPVRKIKIRTLLGNPRLSIPTTGDDKKDAKRRYKGLDGKF